MPYIKKKRRVQLADGQDPLSGIEDRAEVPGELNYLITGIIMDYIEWHGLSYQIINDIVGALECAKLEFYRRIAVPYEETKKAENGDVYKYEDGKN
jgi:hypothetical protein